jgi:tetratricopeptide (TPR) repeat protein
MSALQLIGVCVAIATLGCTAYLAIAKPQIERWRIRIIATTGCFLGLALICCEKITDITLGHFSAKFAKAVGQAEDIDRVSKQVSAQSATIDLVAQSAQDAKKSANQAQGVVTQLEVTSKEASKNLDALKKTLDEAEGQLKTIEEKTAVIVPLADGRVRVGDMISGDPSVLRSLLKDQYNLAKQGDISAAFDAAKKSIFTMEQSENDSNGTTISTSELSEESKALIYADASKIASEARNFQQSLEWARKADKIMPNAPEKISLFIALMNSGSREEARSMANKFLKEGGPQSEAFRKALLSVTPCPLPAGADEIPPTVQFHL